MITLLEQSELLVSSVSLDFKRYLFDCIKWENRLIGIKNARLVLAPFDFVRSKKCCQEQYIHLLSQVS